MIGRVVTENGVKKLVPLTADCGSGNPCGAIITVYQRTVPNGYLPLGAQYDITQFPVLYSILGTDTIPTASALGLPTLTIGQYVIKATSGINENQADNVLSALSPVDVVALNNVHSVTSNAVARNIVNAVTSGETKPVTSGAVYSAIRDFFNQSNETITRSANLNNVTYPLVSFDTNTQNKPTDWGVCYTFGRAIYSTEAGESRWYYQLVFGTNGNIYFRYAENPTSSSTTPDNWTSWKRIAFV